MDPLCSQCVEGNYGLCENLTQGHIAPGLQMGYCRDTGGGWSSALVAHPFQVHQVPETLSDEEAVLIEPFSCALHAVLKVKPDANQTVMVIGCGAIGLLTIAALRMIGFTGRLLAIAKYPHQAQIAEKLGASQILQPDATLYQQVCAAVGTQLLQPELGKPVLPGGVDCTFDCVANSTTIDDALRLTAPGGKVVLVGMPAVPKEVDWCTIWFKELHVLGAYAYGTETYQGERIRTFTLALQLIQQQLGLLTSLITGYFPLAEYRAAINIALHPGSSAAIKTVFDLR
ncbi:MAG: zinc-binding dehydrogenase [Leptolyngbyaceae cyanobacterium CAN_BIN12]|nr:zinc-binding dehydrogenase [Leptolyngbyaceae cyanobacterium CAN_BIN12]